MTARRWRLLFVLAVLVALFFALKPASTEPEPIEYLDKLEHIAAFAVLMVLGVLAALRPVWALALGLLALGIGIEIAQAFTPDRTPDVRDVVADAIGIVTGLLLYVLWRELSQRRASRTPLAGSSQTAAATDATRPR
ncbi:VanZ family protein [Rivibacter subsaxonicus]|uniref:VanZ family protein n=1 Tax=Rivibacter subsaxonicus TaxID=457575 RepID=A0A4Q7VH46_9BURK|nr:VanZ family protein [Rivibacter subsaxonicus]RZT95258.1 VanZ family protein [Rivibacter subsaxonicus]